MNLNNPDVRHAPEYQDCRENPLHQKLMHVLTAQFLTNQHPERHDWHEAILRNLRDYPQYRISHTSDVPFEAAMSHMERHGGKYYEGLVQLPGRRLESGIWVVNGDDLHCYTHDLSGPHAIQGFRVMPADLEHLMAVMGIRGPYLFHPDPVVFHFAVPATTLGLMEKVKGRLQ